MMFRARSYSPFPCLHRLWIPERLFGALLATTLSLSSVWAADTVERSNDTRPTVISFKDLDAQNLRVLDKDLRSSLLVLVAKAASGNFKETRTLPGFPKPMVSYGVFRLKENDLTWETQTPFPSVLRISPVGIVMEADGERQELSPSEIPATGRIAEILSAILSGRLSVLEELFEVRAVREESRVLFVTHPKPNAQLARVIKTLRASALLDGNAHVEALELEAADGTLTRIDLTQVKVTH